MPKGVVGKVAATCHPERSHLARGLCEVCYRAQWRAANPERERELQRQSNARQYKQDPVKHRRRVQAARYGLTVEEVQAMRWKQDDCCAVCGDRKPLQVDHCHSTGKVRAMLCNSCNVALGHAKDDPERLRRLIAYLESFSTSPAQEPEAA